MTEKYPSHWFSFKRKSVCNFEIWRGDVKLAEKGSRDECVKVRDEFFPGAEVVERGKR